VTTTLVATEKRTDDRIDVLDHGFVRLDGVLADDLSVVNAARVSFGRRREVMDERDEGLIRFLMRDRHGTPFEHNSFRFHVRAPIFVAREWMRHRVGCLVGDTEVTFVNTNGVTGPKLRKTIDELWRMWSVAEANPHALPATQRSEIELLSSFDFSQRAISRLTGAGRRAVRSYLAGANEFRDGRWRVRRMRLRVLNEQTNEFENGHVTDVIDKGLQPVYKVTLADGKELTLTENHRVLTADGWMRMRKALGLVGEGDGAVMTRPCSLIVNGEPAVRDAEWLRAQRRLGRSVGEIAAEAGCSYHTVRKWLARHGLQFAPGDATRGRPPWNAGIAGYKNNYVVTDAHRAAIRRARSGSASNFWRGGISTDRASIARWTTEQAPRVHAVYDFTCQSCGVRGGRLHAHHIAPVWLAPERGREIGNLITVCHTCHAAIHRTRDSELSFANRFAHRIGYVEPGEVSRRGWKLTAHPVGVVGVEYVGIRQTYDICVDGPWHNFVANGVVVHNSFNEFSLRYAKATEDFYVPEADDVRTQVGKPGAYTFDPVEPELAEQTRDELRRVYEAAYDAYARLVELGVAREVARSVLPVGAYTEFYWTVNARSLMNFVSLRAAESAQREIRRYAGAVEQFFARHMPVTHAAFVANGRVAP
jgi:thymidylate synthase (FAD)